MRRNGAVIECCCPHGHMAHCINSEHEHSHEGSTSRLDFSKLAQDTGHVLIGVGVDVGNMPCVAKLSALAVQISMLHAMLCAVCCHELSSYRYADVMTHFECFGEFASFRLKTYITVNYFSKGQKAKRSHILSRDFPKGHLFCSTTQYSRYFQGHLFCCLRYLKFQKKSSQLAITVLPEFYYFVIITSSLEYIQISQ